MTDQNKTQENMTRQEPEQAEPSGTANPSAPPETQPDKPKYTGWKRVLYCAYVTLTVLSAIIVVGYIAFHSFAAPPSVEKLGRREAEDASGERAEGHRTRPPAVTVEVTTDPDTGKVIEYEAEVPGLSSERKKEFYTFLVVGQDQTGGKTWVGNTDTMMLVAYDVPNQQLAVMSLPRDTYVRYFGKNVLLNSIYSRAGGKANGIKRLKEEVSELTGVYPDFYVMVRWEAIGELVDAIDGVEFEVPFDMYYNDRSQHFKIDLKEGLQTLNGSKAMQLIRYRMNSKGDTGKIDYSYGYRDGDLGRIKTQQAFVKAIIKKCLQPDILLPHLGNYIDVFQKNVETDLTVGNMTYFGKSAIGGLDMDSVIVMTMPNVAAGDSHLLPAGGELVTAVNRYFNPYRSDIRRYELDLVDSVAASSTSKTASPTESVSPSDSPKPVTDENVDPRAQPTVSAEPEESPEPTDTHKPTERANVPESPSPSPALQSTADT